jgi:hypothetical protein
MRNELACLVEKEKEKKGKAVSLLEEEKKNILLSCGGEDFKTVRVRVRNPVLELKG